MKTTERNQWCCSGVFNVNFEHILHFFIVFLLLTLNRSMLVELVNLKHSICKNLWKVFKWKLLWTSTILQEKTSIRIIIKRYNSLVTHLWWSYFHNPVGIYMFKANNRNTRTSCEICSKLKIKTPERRLWLYY